MSVANSLFGLQGVIDTVTNSLGNAFGDIWCVAIFVLIDMVTPYVSQFLFNMGFMGGIGSVIFNNFILVLKLQVCEEWKGKFKIHG